MSSDSSQSLGAFFPMIYFAHRRTYWLHIVRGLSITVFVMGMIWLVQRAFLSG